MKSSIRELIELSACQAVDRLRAGELSPVDLVEAAAARIEQCEPHLNALPTRCLERARDHAVGIAKGKLPSGALGGLPIAIKDLNPVAGVRTTYGSRIYANHIAERSDVLVEQLEREGGIVCAKSNTPEFGAGASTFNEVFGRTHNPWNHSKSVGGSSGGSAAAVASGEVWLAQGSDLGGSLRIPGSFNGVVGLRPSVGRVPRGLRHPFGTLMFDTLYVEGPIGRSVEDVALFLDAMAVAHPEEPLSFPPPATPYREHAARPQAPKRVAWSPDLGITPVDPEVVEICKRAVRKLEAVGTSVESACADFSQAVDVFQVLRAAFFAAEHEEHLRAHRDLLKDDVIWNTEKGLALTGGEIGAAELARSQICVSLLELFATHDLLVCPTVLVPPFDVEVRYVDEVAGVRFDNYIHWLVLTYAITLTGCPAISLPAGFTESGLPVGIQLIGPHRSEAALFAMAAALEAELGIAQMFPIDPRSADDRSLIG